MRYKVFNGEVNPIEVVFQSDSEEEIIDVLGATDNFYAEDERGNTLTNHNVLDGVGWQIAGKDFT